MVNLGKKGRLQGMDMDPDMVHVGKDGYLFLSGGAHRTTALFSGQKTSSSESVEAFFDNFRSRNAFCEARGISFQQVVFPDKLIALANWVTLPDTMQSAWLRDYRNADCDGGRVNYPLDVVEGHPDYFPKTDTHYSVEGILALTEAICERYHENPVLKFRENMEEYVEVSKRNSGDLGKKIQPNATERIHAFRKLPIKGAVVRSNGMAAGNTGIMDLARNPRPLLDKRLLIFGDSFFRQMIPVLQSIFRHVVFCRSQFFHAELVDAIAPDILFCGMAERYLSVCKSDRARHHFLALPAVLGRPMVPEKGFEKLWNQIVDREKLWAPDEVKT